MRESTVHLFIFYGMADWEAAFAIAGINNPRFQRATARYRVATVAAGRHSIITAGGMRVQPDFDLSEIIPETSAMLILPGGEAWETGRNSEAVTKACEFMAAGVPVAAICGATQAVARAGLLDHRRHTSNAREYLAQTGYGGDHLYCDVPAITDGNLITASGIAPVDFAREIFRTLDLYDASALDAWYDLFKHADASKYYELADQAVH
jgi:putative intracellular protease/amidase